MLEALQPILSTYTYIDRRILKKALHNVSGRVLDVGCGNKRLKQYLPATTEYIGIDFNPAADIQMDISQKQYPFEDNSFDYVICNAVLEHVKDDNFVLSEIYRVLKPGGTAYISIPFMQPFHADPDDFRRYTAEGLRLQLEKHGFKNIQPMEAYGTLLTVEYLIFAEFGKYMQLKKRFLNPLRWLYLAILVGIYFSCKIANILFYTLQKRDTYISPGSKCLCQK